MSPSAPWSSCSHRTASFFFLEMNTRLQVEHPITEAVYGIDLVCEQIAIALGERLSYSQESLTPRGHAIECRVYAEDPLRNFAPSPGRISLLINPDGPGVRVDSGVIGGSVVPLEYDPMLAKLVVWAPDRPAAIERLRRALQEYRILGIATTLSLFAPWSTWTRSYRRTCTRRFWTSCWRRVGWRTSTASRIREAEHAAVVAAACLATLEAASLPDDPFAPAHQSGWWTRGHANPAWEVPAMKWVVRGSSGSREVEVERSADGFEVTVDGTSHAVDLIRLDGAIASLRFVADGRSFQVSFDRGRNHHWRIGVATASSTSRC